MFLACNYLSIQYTFEYILILNYEIKSYKLLLYAHANAIFNQRPKRCMLIIIKESIKYQYVCLSWEATVLNNKSSYSLSPKRVHRVSFLDQLQTLFRFAE